MLKKTISYEDFDGNPVTEDHYFHLSKADLVEMEMSQEGGLSKELQAVVESNDGKRIIETFKKLILDAYGQKSADGKRFNKSPIIREEFATSEAYSALFMELVTDATAAAEFVNGIVPKGIEQDVAKLKDKAEREMTPPLEPKNVFDEAEKAEADAVAKLDVPRVLTMAEAQAMPANELHNLLARGKAVLASGEG